MTCYICHEIDNHPQAEDVGVIKLSAKIFRENGLLTFSSESFTKDFIDDEQDDCKIKEDLNYFLMEGGVNDDDIMNVMIELICYVAEVTCPACSHYSPGCALYVSLDLLYQEDDAQIDQVVQLSFDEASNIRFRPASKHAVKSLTRKIYNKKIHKENKHISLEECTICLEEFSDGGRAVSLPCGHDFDDECIVNWLETSHVCPLCRFELPCEDQETSVVLSQN